MKSNRKKAVAVAVAAIMGCGMFAGCDLIIQNETENMNQTVAEVNIKNSDNFKAEFSDLNGEIVDKVIGTVSVSKLDMIVSFVGSGYNAMNSYGWSYKDTFDAISDSLVQRQIYIQYAKAYFLKNGAEDGTQYNDLAKFNAAVKDKEGIDYDIAVTKYFLTEEEINKATFTTRVMINNSIDSLEDRFIEAQEHDHDEHDSSVRTTPKGLNTSDSDFCDDDYRIYTGTGKQSAVRGSYEAKDGSNSTTRRRAYNELLTSLKSNNLVKNGEDTSDVETLEYFLLENKADLEDALIQKMTDTFTKQAEEKIDAVYVNRKFTSMLSNQSNRYASSYSNLESDMDSVSDSNFVLTATPDNQNYGYVINILLPFSAAQSDELSAVSQDYGDKKGNKFATRAKLLKNIKATDQRGSWFRGETDYSFKATQDDNAFTNGDASRVWLFFEDNLIEETSKYERLKNYYGKYTYNGTWNEKDRKYKPTPIDIDKFIGEMEGYLTAVLGGNAVVPGTKKADYYNPAGGYYYTAAEADAQNGIKEGDVNYSKFVYYSGKVSFNGGFNANNIFKAGSDENKALSVINELSFAYNTDTAGLNTYLGYAVTANKTSFVSEFEYAAQEVVKAGAGNYMVVPSDYGWHIIYCTFSYVDNGFGTGASPFAYDHEAREDEGTFSNLFYESYKADTASTESTNRRSKIISSYNDSYTIYEERYEDLANLGSNN